MNVRIICNLFYLKFFGVLFVPQNVVIYLVKLLTIFKNRNTKENVKCGNYESRLSEKPDFFSSIFYTNKRNYDFLHVLPEKTKIPNFNKNWKHKTKS